MHSYSETRKLKVLRKNALSFQLVLVFFLSSCGSGAFLGEVALRSSHFYLVKVVQSHKFYAESSNYYCLIDGASFNWPKRKEGFALESVTNAGATIVDTYYLGQGNFDNCCSKGYNLIEKGQSNDLAKAAEQYIEVLPSAFLAIKLDTTLSWSGAIEYDDRFEHIRVWKVDANFCKCRNYFNLTMMQDSKQDSVVYLKSLEVLEALSEKEQGYFERYFR